MEPLSRQAGWSRRRYRPSCRSITADHDSPCALVDKNSRLRQQIIELLLSIHEIRGPNSVKIAQPLRLIPLRAATALAIERNADRVSGHSKINSACIAAEHPLPSSAAKANTASKATAARFANGSSRSISQALSCTCIYKQWCSSGYQGYARNADDHYDVADYLRRE